MAHESVGRSEGGGERRGEGPAPCPGRRVVAGVLSRPSLLFVVGCSLPACSGFNLVPTLRLARRHPLEPRLLWGASYDSRTLEARPMALRPTMGAAGGPRQVLRAKGGSAAGDWSRQLRLLQVCMAGWLAIMAKAASLGPSFLTRFGEGGGNPFVSQWPFVCLCFGSADMLAQYFESLSGSIGIQTRPKTILPARPKGAVTVTGDEGFTWTLQRRRKGVRGFADALDLRRVACACAVGCFLAGLLTVIWFHHVDIVIPRSTVGFHSTSAALALLVKSVIHSFLYGTISNTIGIVGRRLFRGDSLGEAMKFWSERIITVTERQQLFWITWQVVEFGVMDPKFVVPMNAFGAFLWNTFMSWVSVEKKHPSTPPPDNKRGKAVASPT